MSGVLGRSPNAKFRLLNIFLSLFLRRGRGGGGLFGEHQLVRGIDECLHRKAGSNRAFAFFFHRECVPFRVVNRQSNKFMVAPPKAFCRASHMTEFFGQGRHIPYRFIFARDKCGSNPTPISILNKQERSSADPSIMATSFFKKEFENSILEPESGDSEQVSAVPKSFDTAG